MKSEQVWRDSIERALDRGFNLYEWDKKHDPEAHSRYLKQLDIVGCSYQQAVCSLLTYTKMKALAFSHEFALCFFPREKCEDPECIICKNEGGHHKHVTHMKAMCEYADFTAYLEIIMDEED